MAVYSNFQDCLDTQTLWPFIHCGTPVGTAVFLAEIFSIQLPIMNVKSLRSTIILKYLFRSAAHHRLAYKHKFFFAFVGAALPKYTQSADYRNFVKASIPSAAVQSVVTAPIVGKLPVYIHIRALKISLVPCLSPVTVWLTCSCD